MISINQNSTSSLGWVFCCINQGVQPLAYSTMGPEIWWWESSGSTPPLPNIWTYGEPQVLRTGSHAQSLCAGPGRSDTRPQSPILVWGGPGKVELAPWDPILTHGRAGGVMSALWDPILVHGAGRGSVMPCGPIWPTGSSIWPVDWLCATHLACQAKRLNATGLNVYPNHKTPKTYFD